MTEQGENPPKSFLDRRISRRSLLTGMAKGAIAAGAVMAGVPPDVVTAARVVDKLTSPEKGKTSGVLILDIFGFEGIRNKILGRFLPSESPENTLWAEMGVSDPNTSKGLMEAVPRGKVQEKLFMLKAMEQRYGNHGNLVVDSVRKFREKMKISQEERPVMTNSIVEAIKMGGVEHDSLGNLIGWTEIIPEVVSNLVDQSSSDVINMSFELGRIPTQYFLNHRNENGEIIPWKSTDRDIEFIDGYGFNSELTLNNLIFLTDLASKNPEKMIIAAAGNPTTNNLPDISQARAQLSEKGIWPENLIMVGVAGKGPMGFWGPYADGADFYVDARDLESMGLEPGASFATAIFSELTSILKEGGNTEPQLLKQRLIGLCNQKGTNEDPYYLLDFNKVREELETGEIRAAG